jgi:hypothetical protein
MTSVTTDSAATTAIAQRHHRRRPGKDPNSTISGSTMDSRVAGWSAITPLAALSMERTASAAAWKATEEAADVLPAVAAERQERIPASRPNGPSTGQ